MPSVLPTANQIIIFSHDVSSSRRSRDKILQKRQHDHGCRGHIPLGWFELKRRNTLVTCLMTLLFSGCDERPDCEKYLGFSDDVNDERNAKISRPGESTVDSNGNSQIRFDGLYESRGDDYTSFLRFNAEGAVLHASVEPLVSAEYVARWLHFGDDAADHHSIGQYRIHDNSLEFSTRVTVEMPESLTVVEDGEIVEYRAPAGERTRVNRVDYSGTIANRVLHMRSCSYSTGHQSVEDYLFIPLATEAISE